MYNDNIAAWVEQMRTTDERQANGALCKKQRVDGQEVEAFCCLGLGTKEFVPNLRINIHRPVDNDDTFYEEDTIAWSEETDVYFNDVKDLAPVEFRVWLGVLHEDETQTATAEKDVEFDVPNEIAELLVQGARIDDETYATREEHGMGRSVINQYLSAATANDGGFTFKQIADMVAYFGLKREGE